MAGAVMSECGCGYHPYHESGIDLTGHGHAYVRCAQHSKTGKKKAYKSGAAWEKDYNEAVAVDEDGFPLR